MAMKTYPMRIKDGKLYAEVTLRDVVERSDVSDLPMLSEIKRLYEENDKMRELVAELYQCSRQCGCDHCGDGYRRTCIVLNRMRELGIEVDG